MERLEPGPANPNAPLDLAGIAERYDVPVDQVAGWCEAGLPRLDEGDVDPFAACNWLTWNRLAEVPALRRAWRGYLLVFSGFLGGDHRSRQITWNRRHRAEMPVTVDSWTWWLPRACDSPSQKVLRDDGCAGQALPAGQLWRLSGGRGVSPRCEGEIDLLIRPVTSPADALADLITGEILDLAGTFRYEYIHHHQGERLDGGEQDHGSCLDCARALTTRLRRRGLDARVVPGIIAHDAFANPHFWVEVDDGFRIRSIDPSLPAIARMLGADWQAVARAYARGVDGRRVRLSHQPVDHLPHGPTVNGAVGELTVEVDGKTKNAWACIDWVCGECDATFAEVRNPGLRDD